jgi:hypothetical protein
MHGHGNALQKEKNRIFIPAGAVNFLIQYCVMLNSAARSISYSVLQKGIYPGGKPVGN